MRKLSYEEYLDKVYGCWLGKCVIGTLGAPYEGMKQINRLTFRSEMIEEMLPNDDLDLQVLWLSVLEEKGCAVTGEDLAQCFLEKNIKWPGEYAYFRRNYVRGIRPPYTGIYENDFYVDGMGCPIRAEIWGMILPGNPKIAAELSEIDGTLDHVGTSVYFEKFWTAMISASFFEEDIYKLIDEGLNCIPEDCEAYRLIKDTLAWCAEMDDPFVIRSYIIGKYGHCDCTNACQNIGLTLLALLKGKGDPLETGILCCNMGFDTDCTAGNAGALLGAIYGAKGLAKYGIKECTYKLTLRYRRRTDNVKDLAEDTALVGLHFLKRQYNGAVQTVDFGDLEDKITDAPMAEAEVVNYYDEEPYIAPNESVCVSFAIYNHTDKTQSFELITSELKDFDFVVDAKSCVVEANSSILIKGKITCHASEWLEETNLFTLQAVRADGQAFERNFGVIGKRASVWYGPFWENSVDIDLEADGGKNRYNYANVFTGETVHERVDNMRRYQLNMVTDFDKDYLGNINENPDNYENQPKLAFLKGDTFEVKDFSSFRGPAVYYVKQTYRFPKKQRVCFFMGHQHPFEWYLDGKRLLRNPLTEGYTPENAHYYHLILDEGEHEFICKLDATTGNAKYSFIINIDDETGQYPHTTCATRIEKKK